MNAPESPIVPLSLPETGIREIDRQHGELLESLQKLSSWIGTPSEIAAVFSAISYLNDYVDKHFQFEERFLEENGYPNLPKHVEEHAAIRARVADLTSKILDGGEITEEIMATMTQWIVGHIGEEDLEYAAFLKGDGTAGFVPAEA
ncbi:MAG: hemerythrin family protein [Patescibacteria group bacterium]